MRRWLRGAAVALTVLILIITGCAGKQTPASQSAAARSANGISRSWEAEVQYSGHVVIDMQRGQSTEFQMELGKRIVEIITDGKFPAEFASAGGTRADAFTMFQSGTTIVMDSWEPTNLNMDAFLASPPYYTDSLRVLVRTSTGVKKIEDLDGKEVAHINGSHRGYQHLVPQYFKEKYPNIKVQFREFGLYPVGVKFYEILAGPETELAPFVKPDSGWMLLPERLATWNHSLYVSKETPDLAVAVDKAIRQMTESGELAKLVKKWGLDI